MSTERWTPRSEWVKCYWNQCYEMSTFSSVCQCVWLHICWLTLYCWCHQNMIVSEWLPSQPRTLLPLLTVFCKKKLACYNPLCCIVGVSWHLFSFSKQFSSSKVLWCTVYWNPSLKKPVNRACTHQCKVHIPRDIAFGDAPHNSGVLLVGVGVWL